MSELANTDTVEQDVSTSATGATGASGASGAPETQADDGLNQDERDYNAAMTAVLEKVRGDKVAAAEPKAEPVKATPAATGKVKDPVTGQYVSPARIGHNGAPPEAQLKPDEITPPSSWRKEAQAKFSTLDPEVKAEVMRVEKDAARGFSKLGGENQQLKQTLERVDPYIEVYRKHDETLRGWGGNPVEHVDRAVEFFKRMDADPVGSAMMLLKNYNVPLSKLAGDLDPFLDENDPRMVDLRTEVDTLKRQLDQVTRLRSSDQDRINRQIQAQQQHEERQRQAEQDQRDAYTSNIISDAATSWPDFDTVAPDIMAILPGIVARMPDATPDQRLKKAYDTARLMNPATAGAITNPAKDAKRADDLKRSSDAARAATAINVQSFDSGQVDEDETAMQMAALQAHRSRQASSARY
jgi:hypothetical protein